MTESSDENMPASWAKFNAQMRCAGRDLPEGSGVSALPEAILCTFKI